MSVYIKEPSEQAQACVIWMHGLGADAQDMAGLAEQLSLKIPVRHVFMDAPVRPVTLNNGMPMRAWYDIVGLTVADREDSIGIAQSETLLRDVINSQCDAGFQPSQIYLAGFSQGGAMALFAGLQAHIAIGGIIALSGYLPLASACQIALDVKTPLFIAFGTNDEVVLPNWTRQAIDFIKTKGFHNLSVYDYPMGHSVCIKEINDIALWLHKCIEQEGEIE